MSKEQEFKVGQRVWSITSGISGYILKLDTECDGCFVILCGNNNPSFEPYEDLEITDEDYVTYEETKAEAY